MGIKGLSECFLREGSTMYHPSLKKHSESQYRRKEAMMKESRKTAQERELARQYNNAVANGDRQQASLTLKRISEIVGRNVLYPNDKRK